MSEPKKILLCAGGTGGHMFPADALARDLISRGYQVELATDMRGKKYAPFAGGIPLHVLASGTLGPGIATKVKSVFALGRGYIQSLSLLKKVKPAVVVGFGGYPSFPPVLAAQQKGIPTIIHEQNAILGKANVLLAHKASRIGLPLSDVRGLDDVDRSRAVVTGNPVRPDIAALYAVPYPMIQQDGPLKIFVTGGSQGAGVFGTVLPAAFMRLPAAQRVRLEIVQQCRPDDIEQVREAYAKIGVKARLETFFTDMAAQLAACHLFIGRSGAGTVAEVTAAGRPAIFVPYPWHADQQQKRNAEAVADLGGAWVMTQGGFTEEALLARIETFLQNPETLFRAAETARACGRPDAARRLGNLVTELVSGWERE